MKDSDVVVIRTERDLVYLCRRDSVLDLHRALVHDQHGTGGYHKENRHELEEKRKQLKGNWNFVIQLVSV